MKYWIGSRTKILARADANNSAFCKDYVIVDHLGPEVDRPAEPWEDAFIDHERACRGNLWPENLIHPHEPDGTVWPVVVGAKGLRAWVTATSPDGARTWTCDNVMDPKGNDERFYSDLAQHWNHRISRRVWERTLRHAP